MKDMNPPHLVLQYFGLPAKLEYKWFSFFCPKIQDAAITTDAETFTFDDCIFKRFRFKLECKGRDDRDLDLQCDNIWPKLETVAIFVVFVSSFANFLSYFGKFSSFKWKILNKNLAI